MPDFQIRHLPAPVGQGLQGLMVYGQSEISGDQFRAIEAATKLHVDKMVARLVGPLEVSERDYEFEGHVQVDAVGTKEAPSDKYSVFFTLEVKPASKKVERKALGEWESFYGAVTAQVQQLAAFVSLRFRVPSHGTVTALKLPIPLSAAEVTGFSEVKGVRLAQVDQSDRERELYSVVLDHLGEVLLVDARTPAELPFDESILEGAIQRCWAVGKQGVPSLKEDA